MRMKNFLIAVVAFSVLSAPRLFAQADPHAGHMMDTPQAAAPSGQRNPNLPPDADAAKDQLAKSPRHGEWVDVKNGSGPAIHSFVVYPERSTKAPVVIVIHEIFGMADWVRGVADQLAKEGFIAIAPDFLSGRGPDGGGTESLGNGVGQAIGKLTADDRNGVLDAVMAYGKTLPASNGKTATIGFCWGGGTSFSYALYQPGLDAAVSYYGPMPSEAAAYASAKGKAPILGLYGGNDARVDANIPVAETELKKLGESYNPNVFEGAGHGFLRQQNGADGANMKATAQAWPKTLGFLRQHTDGRSAPR
jgi:carboxymethylenebutenolidase